MSHNIVKACFLSVAVFSIALPSIVVAESCTFKNFGSFGKYYQVYDANNGSKKLDEFLGPGETRPVKVSGQRINYRYRQRLSDSWSPTNGAYCNDGDTVNATLLPGPRRAGLGTLNG
jgi:hypothetical protein